MVASAPHAVTAVVAVVGSHGRHLYDIRGAMQEQRRDPYDVVFLDIGDARRLGFD